MSTTTRKGGFDMRLRLSILTACALSVAAVFAAPASAILDGSPDSEGHDYVGVLLGAARCTGTLVAPDLVVTAAHCFYAQTAPNTPPELITTTAYFRLGNPVEAPSAIGIASYVRGSVSIHPGFSASTPTGLTHDLAVVKLAAPYPGVSDFAKISKLGVVDAMRAKRHKAQIVGYGATEIANGAPAGNGGLQGPWTRYVNHIRLLTGETLPGPLRTVYAKSPTHVVLERTACRGDSGGPVMRGRHVVAVTSFGLFPACAGEALGYRLDTPVAQEFLASLGVAMHDD